MSKKENREFVFRNTGSSLDGKRVIKEVPVFDWEIFKKLPNAERYVKNFFDGDLQKLVREIEEVGKNATTDLDIACMENVIVRSMRPTKDEFENWYSTRDWARCEFKDPKKGPAILKDKLSSLIKPGRVLRDKTEVRGRYAYEFVAKVADKPQDSIADFFFSKLSQDYSLDEDGI